MANFINCTAHDITWIRSDKTIFNQEKKCYTLIENDTEEYLKAIIHPCGKVARCKQEQSYQNTEIIEPNEFTDIFVSPEEADINNYVTTYGEVFDLPEPQENTLYIVSALVANALKGIRNDLRIPTNMVKNLLGQPIGCLDLSKP